MDTANKAKIQALNTRYKGSLGPGKHFSFPVLDTSHGPAKQGAGVEEAFNSMMNRYDIHHRSAVGIESSGLASQRANPEHTSQMVNHASNYGHSRGESTNTLRAFRLRSVADAGGRRVAPTF